MGFYLRNSGSFKEITLFTIGMWLACVLAQSNGFIVSNVQDHDENHQIFPLIIDSSRTKRDVEFVLSTNSELPASKPDVNTSPKSAMLSKGTSNNHVDQRIFDESNQIEVNPKMTSQTQSTAMDMDSDLEYNIRNSVKDEILPDQPFESSAIDVIDDIPDRETKEAFTADIMAMEYPQNPENRLATPIPKVENASDISLQPTTVIFLVATESGNNDRQAFTTIVPTIGRNNTVEESTFPLNMSPIQDSELKPLKSDLTEYEGKHEKIPDKMLPTNTSTDAEVSQLSKRADLFETSYVSSESNDLIKRGRDITVDKESQGSIWHNNIENGFTKEAFPTNDRTSQADIPNSAPITINVTDLYPSEGVTSANSYIKENSLDYTPPTTEKAELNSVGSLIEPVPTIIDLKENIPQSTQSSNIIVDTVTENVNALIPQKDSSDSSSKVQNMTKNMALAPENPEAIPESRIDPLVIVKNNESDISSPTEKDDRFANQTAGITENTTERFAHDSSVTSSNEGLVAESETKTPVILKKLQEDGLETIENDNFLNSNDANNDSILTTEGSSVSNQSQNIMVTGEIDARKIQSVSEDNHTFNESGAGDEKVALVTENPVVINQTAESVDSNETAEIKTTEPSILLADTTKPTKDRNTQNIPKKGEDILEENYPNPHDAEFSIDKKAEEITLITNNIRSEIPFQVESNETQLSNVTNDILENNMPPVSTRIGGLGTTPSAPTNHIRQHDVEEINIEITPHLANEVTLSDNVLKFENVSQKFNISQVTTLNSVPNVPNVSKLESANKYLWPEDGKHTVIKKLLSDNERDLGGSDGDPLADRNKQILQTTEHEVNFSITTEANGVEDQGNVLKSSNITANNTTESESDALQNIAEPVTSVTYSALDEQLDSSKLPTQKETSNTLFPNNEVFATHISEMNDSTIGHTMVPEFNNNVKDFHAPIWVTEHALHKMEESVSTQKTNVSSQLIKQSLLKEEATVDTQHFEKPKSTPSSHLIGTSGFGQNSSLKSNHIGKFHSPDDTITTEAVSIHGINPSTPGPLVSTQIDEEIQNRDDKYQSTTESPTPKTPTQTSPDPMNSSMTQGTFTYHDESQSKSHPDPATSTETAVTIIRTLIEAAELTTDLSRQINSFRSINNETSAIPDNVIPPAVAEQSVAAIVAEGSGKVLPTRSITDEPSSSFYASEDKTTTIVVLCSTSGVIFLAFSIAIYLITFQRQHGTLDIELQEQRCGKDDLDDVDAETRMSLLRPPPLVENDEQSFE